MNGLFGKPEGLSILLAFPLAGCAFLKATLGFKGLFDKPCRPNFPVPVGLFAEVKRGFAASRGKAFLNGFRGSLEEEVSLGLTRFFKYGLGRGDRGFSPVVDR